MQSYRSFTKTGFLRGLGAMSILFTLGDTYYSYNLINPFDFSSFSYKTERICAAVMYIWWVRPFMFRISFNYFLLGFMFITYLMSEIFDCNFCLIISESASTLLRTSSKILTYFSDAILSLLLISSSFSFIFCNIFFCSMAAFSKRSMVSSLIWFIFRT